MRSRRTIATVALFAVVALIAAACEADPADAPEDAVDEPEEAEEPAEPEDEGEEVAEEAEEDAELTVWFPGNLPEEIEFVNEELIPSFEDEHPNVSVSADFVDWADMDQRLATGFAGDTAPDLWGHGVAATAGFVAEDRVEPLDGYLDELDQEDREDLVFLEEGAVEGTNYFVPLRGFGRLIGYRTDHFEEAGLDPADPPTTWDELREAAEALSVSDNGIERSGLVFPTETHIDMTQSFGTLLFQADGDFVNEDGTEILWNSDAGVEALEFLVDLYEGEDAVSTGVGEAMTGAGAEHPLATERASMSQDDEDTVASIYEGAPEAAEVIEIMPPAEHAVQASFGGAGNGLYINADSPHPDEAWDFIEHFMEPEHVASYAAIVGGIPARESVADDPEIQELPYLQPYIEAADTFQGNPNIPEWTEVRDTLGIHLEEALLGVTEPQEALDTAAEEAQAILDG